MTAVILDEPLWTIGELAGYLQVPVKTIYEWRTKGKGPKALLIGRHLRWRRADVMAWLETQ